MTSIAAIKRRMATTISHRFPRFWMERELRLRPQHFEPELLLVPLFCDRSKIAIDVGANMGIYSYSMAKYSKSVVAFEPNRDLWPSIRRLVGSDVVLNGAALSSGAGEATLRLDPTNTGVATIEENNVLTCVSNQAKVIARMVDVRSLDSFNYVPVSMIKIDVEGHEEAVIDGAQMTLRTNRPVLLIESENRHNPGAPRRLAEKLSGLDYRGFYISGRSLLPFTALRDEDMDPALLQGSPKPYINNFIFIPSDSVQLVADITSYLTRT